MVRIRFRFGFERGNVFATTKVQPISATVRAFARWGDFAFWEKLPVPIVSATQVPQASTRA
jgi:hypothetical protein